MAKSEVFTAVSL